MDLTRFERVSATEWRLPPQGAMRVPAVLYASETLVREMDDKVAEQMANVAALPGIVRASYAMPGRALGLRLPRSAAWRPSIPTRAACLGRRGGLRHLLRRVRMLHTGLPRAAVEAVQPRLADALFRAVPAGVGSTGALRLGGKEMDAMLAEGARWAGRRGHGEEADLERIEERGTMAGARPECVSEQAKTRQRDQVGTLGSGNHYLEVQVVAEIHDEDRARAYGLAHDRVVVSIHCGSRGLGHQIGTDFVRRMTHEARQHGLAPADRELACAPIRSALGQEYLGAMRAAMNCALANRQVLTALVREVFADVLPAARLPLLYDVSHNTCKEEWHLVDGARRRLFVHRKGRHARLRPGPSRRARRLPRRRPARDHRRQHGHLELRAGRARDGRGAQLRLGLPRRGPRHEPQRGHAPLRRTPGRRRARGARNPDPQPLAARHRRGGTRGLQGQRFRGRGRRAGGLARRVARLEPLVCIKG
jgi:tRNA-splicing ligase RtcB